MDNLSQLSRKTLLKLYRKESMTRSEISAALGCTDFSQPNVNLSQLIAKGYIKTKKTGTSDGEGGLRDETVLISYFITESGKTAVEAYRRKLIKWGIGTVIAFAGSLAALLTVLLGIL